MRPGSSHVDDLSSGSDLAARIGRLDRGRLTLLALDLQARVDALESARREPIALVGMACRFPGGANDPAAYWRLLADGRAGIGPVPPDRWDSAALFDPDPDAPGKTYARAGGFLVGVDLAAFDASFFGIAPREAAGVSPQQRLLLEVAWEALEDAGLPADGLAGGRTGVFVGLSSDDYFTLAGGDDLVGIDSYLGTGIAPSVAAGRIAHTLGVQGPCLAVDTACSSSLVALHLACQSLRSGECDLALAGGVSLMVTPHKAVYLAKLRALAPDGRCKPFDAAADGIGQAEGCGVVVLKRLADARRDGDRIVALVRGSAVNHDGRSSGLTVPNGSAQQAVLREALTASGVAPTEVGYVEAHGTGTPLGDPIEVAALGAVYRTGRSPDRPLLIGSAKANLGHLDAAAGMAGLIKVALMLRHEHVPAQPGLGALNPRLDLAAIPAEIPRATRSWPRGDSPRLAAVSSFGLSGTNAHVVLEEPPAAGQVDAAAPTGARPLLLSARDPAALSAMAGAYRARLPRPGADERLDDVAYSAAARRMHHPWRLGLLGRDAAELAERLEGFLADRPVEGVFAGHAAAGRPRIAFVFPGQGGQWAGMGRELSAREPVFRGAIERCELAMRRHVDWSLTAVLASEEPDALEAIDVVQPALFAFQVGLAALWRSWGIAPDAVVGHSLGEVAAAHVAGALDLDEAARLVCCRSRLLRRLAGRGAMALVDRSAEQTRVLLDGYADRLEVAVLNGPRGTVVAGEPTTLSSWLASIEGRGVFCRRLNVDVAAHTRQVDALERCLREELAGLDGRPAAVPVYSTVLGEPIEGGRLDAAYWFANARQPVRFQRAVERASADGYGVFLELSPQPTLTHAIEDTLGATGQSGVVVGSCRRGAAAEALLEASCALWADGAALDWSCRFPPGRRLVDLPAYPWQRQRHWVERPRRWTPAPGAGEPPAVLPAPPAASVRPESDRHDVDALVRDCAARVLRVRPDALAQDVPLAALGLDSLMCLELRRRLQSAVGASPSLAALAMGSVAAIAAELRGAAAKRGTAERSELRHQVVPLRPIGPRATRPPLFFCAPIFGVAYPYLALAAHLGDDQPFYVLQPPGMDGGAPAESIEALAEAHVRALRGVHPEGPCYVGGWSFGALVAYELACQLAEAGRPPDAVALVDALAPTGHPSGWRFFWYLLEQGAPGTFVHLGRYTRLRWTGRGSGREARGADASAVPGVRELLGVCFAGFRAGRRYEPRAYAGRVALLRTARTPPADAHGRDDGSWGWARLAQRGVDVREVPGGHIDVIRAPHVAVLAARLRGVLDGAPTWLGASTPAVGPTPSAP